MGYGGLKMAKETKEKKEIQYNLGGFFISSYACFLDAVDVSKLLRAPQYPFTVQVICGVTKALNAVVIRTDVRMRQNEEDEEPVLGITTDTVFPSTNLEDYIVEGGLDLPKPFLGTLISIALSTTRGALIGKNFGTPFSTIFMPLFDVGQLIPQTPIEISKEEPISSSTEPSPPSSQS